MKARAHGFNRPGAGDCAHIKSLPFAALAFAGLLLSNSACQTVSPPAQLEPETPVETVAQAPDLSEPDEASAAGKKTFFEVVDRGVVINVREGAIRYEVVIEAPVGVIEPLYLTIKYENPIDALAPHIEKRRLDPDEPFLLLLSPPIAGMEVGREYGVEIHVFRDAARAQPVAKDVVTITSVLQLRDATRQSQ